MAENRPSARAKVRHKLDLATLLGLLLALGGILGGLLLEGGRLLDLSQYTAAMIVCAGTAGAVMVTTPAPAALPSASPGQRRILGNHFGTRFYHGAVARLCAPGTPLRYCLAGTRCGTLLKILFCERP